MTKKREKLETILLTGNKKIFKVAKVLLDESGIEFFVKGDGVSSLNDGFPLNTRVEIQVFHDKAAKAKTLLADLQELDFDEVS